MRMEVLVAIKAGFYFRQLVILNCGREGDVRREL
jgi:hypothetical protein